MLHLCQRRTADRVTGWHKDRYTGQNAVTNKVTVVNRKHAPYFNNAEVAGLSVRHNLDLYNDIQVEKFIRRVAENLEGGSIALPNAIPDITSQLEQYRLKQLNKQETKKEKALSKEEREAVLPLRFVYDYFLKDHLGNARAALTEKQPLVQIISDLPCS